MKVAVISCGKLKAEHLAKARDLYIGDFFKKNLQHAEKNCDKVYILSAKHKVLELDTVIAPYELTLKNMPLKIQKIWGTQTAHELNKKLDKDAHLYIYAGEKYYKHLLPSLKNNYTIMFEGLTIGKRMKALT